MMLSRTSARQLRMRQQTLNEERMSQSQNLSRVSGERRSSGSKLIISSPTPPMSHVSAAPAQPVSQSTPISDSIVKPAQVPPVCSGTSALLAFLSGTDHRMPSSTQTASSGFQSPLIRANPNSPPVTSSQPFGSNSASNGNGIYGSSTFVRDPGKATIQYQPSRQTSRDSTHPSSAVKADSGIGGGLMASSIEQGSSEVDSNLSPLSSDLNSAMDSCFDNIMEDQEGDNIDLNNITPSIHLSSSINDSSDILGYTRQNSSAGNVSYQPVSKDQPQVGIRIGLGNDADNRMALDVSQHGPFVLDPSLAQASSSCPAEMENAVHSVNTSPLQVSSYGTTFGTGGSGGSLTGTSVGTEGGGLVALSSGSVASPPGLPGCTGFATVRTPEEQRSAWARDRSKKDSHNRIERKRRDYINCQISELGHLLPEEMFRDGECKKNKGSILKNSVEFICLLRAELAQFMEVRKEAVLAAEVIGKLVRRIQDLEAISEVRAQLPSGTMDYQRFLQEWVLLHERNLQLHACFSPVPKQAHLYQSDTLPESSSPGLSSTGTEDLLAADGKSVYSSPGVLAESAPIPCAPLASGVHLSSPLMSANISSQALDMVEPPTRVMRTRCTSLTVAAPGDFVSLGMTRLSGSDVHTQLPVLRASARGFSPYSTGQSSRMLPTTSLGTQLRQGQQQQPSFTTSLVRNHVSPLGLNQSRQMPRSRPIGLSSNRRLASGCGLSASLPTNVNPLTSGEAFDPTDPHRVAAHYGFGRPEELLQRLKCEPPSETEPSREEFLYSTESDPPVLNISSSQLEALVAPVPTAHSRDGIDLTGSQRTPTAMNITSHGALESDEFRFDDVPME